MAKKKLRSPRDDSHGSDETLMPADPGVGATAVVTGIMAAAVTAMGPIEAGITTALSVPAAALVQAAVNEYRQHQARKVGQVLTEAAASVDISVEDLLQQIGSDPVRLTLLADTLEAASRTNLDSKIALLSRALATGVLATDDTSINEVELLIKVVADLEVPHLRVLNKIVEGSRRIENEWNGVSEKDLMQSRSLPGQDSQISLLQPLLRTLDGNGLIQQTGIGEILENVTDGDDLGGDSNEWAPTQFGRALLQMLCDSAQSTNSTSRKQQL